MHEIFFVILPFWCKILYHTRRLTHIDVIHYFFVFCGLSGLLSTEKIFYAIKTSVFPFWIYFMTEQCNFYDSMRHLRNMKACYLFIASKWQKNEREYNISFLSWDALTTIEIFTKCNKIIVFYFVSILFHSRGKYN